MTFFYIKKIFYASYQIIFCSLCWFPSSKLREFHSPNC